MNTFDPAALECLTALADCGSFDRAAVQLSVTQSAVSQRLRTLETNLGRLLVVRSRPLRLTESGKLLLRYARQLQVLRADITRELGSAPTREERLPMAINADSLATWALPALDVAAQAGRREGFGLELIVDDQDFTHDWLREGAVLGCVSTVADALRGCSVTVLGAMRYVAVVSPAFATAQMPAGLDRSNFTRIPWLAFNRKDDMPAVWASKAFGVEAPRLTLRSVPSTEAHARATVMGWGLGVMPEQMAARWLSSGELLPVHPQVWVDVLLHWHQWTLHDDKSPEPSPRAGALDHIGRALVDGARQALRPASG